MVISSDGEDTDSISSLEDPDILFAPRIKKPKKDEPADTKKPTGIDKALIAQLSKPKKYKNSIDSLVNDAADERKMEETVARVKAAFAQEPSIVEAPLGQGRTQNNALREEMLTSALGDDEDETDIKRLLDAVRRTEALDQDRVWHFLDRTQLTPAMPEFPRDLFAPGSHLAVLRGLLLLPRLGSLWAALLTSCQNPSLAAVLFNLAYWSLRQHYSACQMYLFTGSSAPVRQPIF